MKSDHVHFFTAHAVEAYPREGCGIFLGARSGDDFVVTDVLRAGNLAPEGVRDRYLMDPKSRLRAENEASRRGLSVVGFYHSHPDHDVYFSRTDLENSEEYLLGEPWMPPAYAYLVCSVRGATAVGHGAFLVKEGATVACPIRVDP